MNITIVVNHRSNIELTDVLFKKFINQDVCLLTIGGIEYEAEIIAHSSSFEPSVHAGNVQIFKFDASPATQLRYVGDNLADYNL